MTAALAPMRIGRDLLPGGRAVRLLAGLYFLASVAAFLTVVPGALSWRGIGHVALVFSLVALGYTALVAVLGQRLLVRIDPWLGAILLYAPLALILAPSLRARLGSGGRQPLHRSITLGRGRHRLWRLRNRGHPDVGAATPLHRLLPVQ